MNNKQLSKLFDDLFSALEASGQLPKSDKPKEKQEETKAYTIPLFKKGDDVSPGNDFCRLLDYKNEYSVLILPYFMRKHSKQSVYLAREIHRQFEEVLRPLITEIEGEEIAGELTFPGIAVYDDEPRGNDISLLITGTDRFSKDSEQLVQLFANLFIPLIKQKREKLEKGELLGNPETEVFPTFSPPAKAEVA